MLNYHQRTLGEKHAVRLLVMEPLAESCDALKQKRKARRLREQSLAAVKVASGKIILILWFQWRILPAMLPGPERKQSIATRKEAPRRMQVALGDFDMRTLDYTRQLADGYFSYGALGRPSCCKRKL